MSASNISAKEVRKRMEEISEQLKQIRGRMNTVKHKIVIISGKGGVGKSLVTANLAVLFAIKNKKVAILDADIHGPSIPTIFGLKNMTMYANEKEEIVPIETSYNVKIVSIDFLLPKEETPVIWRGPLVSSAIRQFLAQVSWGELDYLLVDLPPGTGDEALSIAQYLHDLDGGIVITIPSRLSEHVVKKAVGFLRQLKVPILGIIENMGSFICPKCGTEYFIFGKGGGKRIAEEMNVRFLGSIPLDPRINDATEKGIPFVILHPKIEATKRFSKIRDTIEKLLEDKE